MKCSMCGVSFQIDDARTEFGVHFNFDLDYDSDGNRMCGNCAINYIENQIAAGMATFDEIDDDEDIGNDDILSNPGCAACGNPNYPNCQTSCPIFDN